MARKTAIVVVCLAAIAVSLYVTFRPRRAHPPIDPESYKIQWVCEACGHTFLDMPTHGVRPCPQCGKQAAVQSVVYVCGKCGAEFEAWRLKDYYAAESATDEQGKPVLPVTYIKLPGGEWTTDPARLASIECPKCHNADAATLARKTYGPKAKP